MSRHHPNMSMETYYGSVRTTADAIKLFEACRVGTLPRVQRRLSEKERQAIRPGSVFVWDEREAGMRRWTDGKSWSASRVSGSFLTYREMEGKRAGFGGRRNAGRTPDSARASDEDRGSDDHHEGYRYKADGLMKQSFSITTSHGQHLHLISYYARDGRGPANLPDPSSDPQLRHVTIPKGIYPESSVSETSVPVTTKGPMQRHSPYLHSRNPPPPYAYDPNIHGPPPGPGYWGPISPVATPPYNGHPAPYPPGPQYHHDMPPHYAHHPHPGHFSPPHHHMAALPPPPAGKPGIQLPQPQPYPPHQHAVQAPYPPPLSQGPPPPAYHYQPHPHQQPPPHHPQSPYHHQQGPPHPSQQQHMPHHQGPPPPHHHLPSPQLPSDPHHPEQQQQPQQPQHAAPRIAPIDSPKSHQLMAAARESLNLDSRLGSGPLPPPQQPPQQNGNTTPFSGPGLVPSPPLPALNGLSSSSPHHHHQQQDLKPVLSPLNLHPPLAPTQPNGVNGIKQSSSPTRISASTKPSIHAILLPPPNGVVNGIKVESPNGTTPISANGVNGVTRSPLGSPTTHGLPSIAGQGLVAAASVGATATTPTAPADNKAIEALKALNRNLCT